MNRVTLNQYINEIMNSYSTEDLRYQLAFEYLARGEAIERLSTEVNYYKTHHMTPMIQVIEDLKHQIEVQNNYIDTLEHDLYGPDDKEEAQVEQANTDEDEKLIDSEVGQAYRHSLNELLQIAYADGIKEQLEFSGLEAWISKPIDNTKVDLVSKGFEAFYFVDENGEHKFESMEQVFDYQRAHYNKKCECGAHKVKDSTHSTWCPMYGEMK